MLDARSIAGATPRVFALLTGGEDLATSLNADPTPEVLTVPKLLVALPAKAAGELVGPAAPVAATATSRRSSAR